MRDLLTALHTLVSMVPLALQCITISALFLSWFGGHLALEYAAMLKRPAAFSAWVAWLCGLPTMLLLLALLADALWTHDYGKLRLLGGLVVLLLVVCGIGQRACRTTAIDYLYTAGHTDTTFAMTPARTQKTRDS